MIKHLPTVYNYKMGYFEVFLPRINQGLHINFNVTMGSYCISDVWPIGRSINKLTTGHFQISQYFTIGGKKCTGQNYFILKYIKGVYILGLVIAET